jgi:hypothetical protein
VPWEASPVTERRRSRVEIQDIENYDQVIISN